MFFSFQFQFSVFSCIQTHPNILFPLVCVWQPLSAYPLLNFLLQNFLLPSRSLDFFIFLCVCVQVHHQFPMLCILHLCILFVFIRSVHIFCSGSRFNVMVFRFLPGQHYMHRPFYKEAFQLGMDERPHSVYSFLQEVVTDSKVMTIWTRCGYWFSVTLWHGRL